MAKVAVVILNWNGKRYLEQFLPVLIKYLPDYAEIIIADNASSDDSVNFLKTHYPDIRVLEHERNEGFARGYNLAFEKVEAEYYCLLNSDIEVTEHWIEPIIEMMDANPKIAAVQPKLLSYSKRDEFEYAGAAGGYIDKYGYPFCRGRVFGNLEKDHGQYDTEADIFWASGAAMFVRSDVYRTMGGLDPDFFAHMEEIDFCWRIKNTGYKIKINPKSVVYHIGGGTLPKNNSYKTYLNFRNNLLLLHKNLPHDEGKRLLFIRRLLDTLAFGMALGKFHFKDAWAIVRAHRDFREKRKNYKSQPSVNLLKALPEERVNIITAHYLRGVKRFPDLRINY